MTLRLADSSTRDPVGIIEDVLVRVDKFILPADFVVLDIGDDLAYGHEMPLIFGRPFMATAGVKINVLEGTISLKVLGEKVKIQVLNHIYSPEVIKEVFAVDLIKGNSAKSGRIFGPLNPSKPEERAHDHFSPIWGYDNPPCSKDGKPPPLGHDDMSGDMLYHDPFLEEERRNKKKKKKRMVDMKKSPPMREAQKETTKALSEDVGQGKKKNMKSLWLPLPKATNSVIKGLKTCFGGATNGESSSPVNGKKVCFVPP
jgi:hypothetical protein